MSAKPPLVLKPGRRPGTATTASELGQLRARHRDPHPTCAEIDDQRGVILDGDDPADAVLIVRYLA